MSQQSENISQIVIALFRRLHWDHTISAETEFGVDLDIDSNIKVLYYYAIMIQLESQGYIVHMLTREDFANARTIQEIIDHLVAEKRGDLRDNRLQQ